MCCNWQNEGFTIAAFYSCTCPGAASGLEPRKKALKICPSSDRGFFLQITKFATANSVIINNVRTDAEGCVISSIPLATITSSNPEALFRKPSDGNYPLLDANFGSDDPSEITNDEPALRQQV